MTKNSKSMSWTLWSIVTFFYAYQYILRVSPSVMLDDIMRQFAITSEEFGVFSGVYYIGYALAHIPIGIMLDRFKARIVIPSFIILSVVGFLPLVYADSWGMSVFGRFLVGIGSSAAILSVFKIIRMTFEDKKFTRMLGISVMVGLLGAIYGSNPVYRLCEMFGWHNVILGFVGVGVLLSIITFFLIPETKQTSGHSNDMKSIGNDLMQIIKNKRVMLTAFFAALMVGPLEGFADVWGATFLENVYGYDKNMSSSLPSFIFFGMCFGSPVLAYLAEKTGAYYRITMMAALIMGTAFITILMSRPSYMVLAILFSAIGVMCSYQVLVMYMNSKNADERLSNLVTAITNMVIMSFGYIFHYAISKTMGIFWDGTIVNGIPVHSSEAYIIGLSVIPITLFIALAGFLYLSKKNKQKQPALQPA